MPTQFNTSGTTSYGAVLWYNPVIGDFSTQGLPDVTHTLVPSLHNFIYDTDTYMTNAAVSQAMEFGVSMYMNRIGMFFGTQCNHLGGVEWDVLNNVTQQWATAGIPRDLKPTNILVTKVDGKPLPRILDFIAPQNDRPCRGSLGIGGQKWVKLRFFPQIDIPGQQTR